jgi:hypothetical protein
MLDHLDPSCHNPRMTLSEKVKTALDETRILILGAQILLGFQLRGVFSEGYDLLSPISRYLDELALGFMVCTVGLLIAPGPYHRIVEAGRDTGQFHRFVTIIANLALLPFALALGIDLFITADRVFNAAGAIAAGIATTLLALMLWYGFPRLRRRYAGHGERMMTGRQRSERAYTSLHVKIEQMLTEARVILPGAQALFGFQLAIVVTQSFEQLPSVSRIVHAVSLFLVALTVIMLMAPAAYHRIVYAGEDTEDMHRVGGNLVTAATVPFALGLAGDIYVVTDKIVGSPAAGLISAGLTFVLLTGLWYLYPLTVASLRSGESGPRC